MSSDDRGPGRTQPLEPAAPGSKVTRLEIFYDLVFAFAFLNVTTTSAEHLGLLTLLVSFLVLALLWFAWTSFAVLGNAVRADQGIMPLVGFATMIAIFVAAISLPEAFTDQRPGPPGDLVFATCYLLVQALPALAFWYALRDSVRLRHGWVKLATPALASTALLIVAALLPQWLFDGSAEIAARVALWALAVVVAYVISALVRVEGLTIVSAGHWAERHAQIILIALGESILALGVGPSLLAGLPLTWPIIGASALGIALLAALWWSYFDARAIAAERALHRVQGAERGRLVRDAYTYLHLPMIFGIILLSLGLKRLLANIADPTVADRHDTFGGIDLFVLYGGVILYLLAVLSFQLRAFYQLSRLSVAALLVLTALIPVGDRLPALGALSLLTGATVVGAALGSLGVRQVRKELRGRKLEEQRALEVEETEWRRRHL